MKFTALFVVAAAGASGLVTADPSPLASEDAFYNDGDAVAAALMVAAPVLTVPRPPPVRIDGPILPGDFTPFSLKLLSNMTPSQRHTVVMQIRRQRQQQQDEQWQQQVRMQEQQRRQQHEQQQEQQRRQKQLQEQQRQQRRQFLRAHTRANPMDFDSMNRQLRDALARRPGPRGAPAQPQPRAPQPAAPWTPMVAFQPIPYKFPPPRVGNAPPPPAPRAPPVFAAPVTPPRAPTAPVASSPFLGQVKLPGMHVPKAATVPLPTDPAQRDQLRARCMRIANADRIKAVARGSPSAIPGARVGLGTGASTPITTASGPTTIMRGIIRQPRIHGKPGRSQQAKTWTAGANPVRKPKGTRKRATVHQTVVVGGAPPRKRKTTAELLRDRIYALPVGSPLRVTYERRLARLQAAKAGGAAGQKPKTWSAGIPKIVRKPGGKIVRKPKTVRKTVVVVKKPGGGAPRKRKTTAELLRDKINALPVGSPLRKAYERRLARLLKPKTATGYDYASVDDAWDETYDDMWEDNYEGDFSVEDAYDEDAAENAYDGGDFSLSEDAYGDDMWEDSYDGGDFSIEDTYDEDAADDIDEY
ncbi:hypothetical protein GGF32_006771 [Allomyces javanicus]|nr:hypothetical protein GGF32_006771 [Allomyces javanicus]